MITVIADDLTGAAEIAGICLRYGLEVAFGIDTVPKKAATVTVIATDSRSMNENEAYETHHQLAVSILERNKKTILFKKCDSALRGHILTELSALLEATEKKTALLQPANPQGLRCIRNGDYIINNVLIEKTGFAIDPDFPTTTSSVKRLLLKRTIQYSNLETLFVGTINEIKSDGIYVPDCCSKEELITSLNLYNEKMILGGSAAFFEQFLLKHYPNLSEVKPKKYNFSDHYLLLSGSTQPESILFAAKLQNKNCPTLFFPNTLLEKNIEDSHLTDWIDQTTQIYNENKKVVLRISDKIIQFEGSSKILKNRMSIVVQQLLERSTINELFIEGGATAYNVLQKLNWKSFTPIDELAPGVVRMQYDYDTNKHITLKPGSYKWPEKLLE